MAVRSFLPSPNSRAPVLFKFAIDQSGDVILASQRRLLRENLQRWSSLQSYSRQCEHSGDVSSWVERLSALNGITLSTTTLSSRHWESQDGGGIYQDVELYIYNAHFGHFGVHELLIDADLNLILDENYQFIKELDQLEYQYRSLVNGPDYLGAGVAIGDLGFGYGPKVHQRVVAEWTDSTWTVNEPAPVTLFQVGPITVPSDIEVSTLNLGPDRAYSGFEMNGWRWYGVPTNYHPSWGRAVPPGTVSLWVPDWEPADDSGFPSNETPVIGKNAVFYAGASAVHALEIGSGRRLWSSDVGALNKRLALQEGACCMWRAIRALADMAGLGE